MGCQLIETSKIMGSCKVYYFTFVNSRAYSLLAKTKKGEHFSSLSLGYVGLGFVAYNARTRARGRDFFLFNHA